MRVLSLNGVSEQVLDQCRTKLVPEAALRAERGREEEEGGLEYRVGVELPKRGDFSLTNALGRDAMAGFE